MIHEAFIFWAAVAVVILVMWGHTVFDALRAFNRKYHFVEIADDHIYDYDDCLLYTSDAADD